MPCWTAGRRCCCARAVSTRSVSACGVPGSWCSRLWRTATLESTRAEHADLLPLGSADVIESDGTLVVRAELEVVEAIAVRRPDRIADLEPFHIWTTESVRRNRIDFRPRHELSAIVVRARPLAVPVTVPLLPEYAGCRSWVDLDPGSFADVPRLEPVHDDALLLGIAAQVRAAVGP